MPSVSCEFLVNKKGNHWGEASPKYILILSGGSIPSNCHNKGKMLSDWSFLKIFIFDIQVTFFLSAAI